MCQFGDLAASVFGDIVWKNMQTLEHPTDATAVGVCNKCIDQEQFNNCAQFCQFIGSLLNKNG